MQMDHGDMPCHETTDNNSDDSNNGCSDCDCLHCMKMTALPPQTSAQGEVASSVQTFGTESIHSRQSERIFQPPKHIS